MHIKKKILSYVLSLPMLLLPTLLLSLLLTGCNNNQSALYVEQQEDNTTVSDTQAEQTPETTQAPALIYVQVSGAVKNPGVYSLPEGSRIFEAVELAGGLTEQADINSINQAQVLSDGQMIYVYAIGEAELKNQETAEKDDGLVNINTASVEQLMTLPGIGQSKAEAIVSYREEQGAFEKIEELMNITGIKEGVFSKIKDQIKVN